MLETLVNLLSTYQGLAAVAVLLLLAYWFFSASRPHPSFPVITYEAKGLGLLLPSSFHWLKNARDIIAKGQQECNGRCFQVKTGSGYMTVVPNRFAEELKSNKHLNFPEAFAPDLFVNYPGFEGNRAGLQDETFIQDVVRVKLTQSLALVTDALVSETTMCLQDYFGSVTEWKTFPIKANLLDIIARLSSRVFLGEELSHNPDWIRISKEYTVDMFLGAELLKLSPALIRPLVYWFIPTCTRLRRHVRQARKLIMPEVEERRQRAEKLLGAGEKVPKRADAIGWMVEVANGRDIDYVAAQLSLTQAAIHTTSETSAQCIRQLCLNPEAVELLREEAIAVLQEHGWSRVALAKMTLMDSFLKEVQRIDGLSSTSMQRMVKNPITLSDGTVLPKGMRFMIPDDRTLDPDVFSSPETFDMHRFQRMRQRPGEENRHQFVTPTPDGMGFGYGQHACPGRFFASNELKILMACLVLQYDLRLPPGSDQHAFRRVGPSKMIDPSFTVQLRSRTESHQDLLVTDL